MKPYQLVVTLLLIISSARSLPAQSLTTAFPAASSETREVHGYYVKSILPLIQKERLALEAQLQDQDKKAITRYRDTYQFLDKEYQQNRHLSEAHARRSRLAKGQRHVEALTPLTEKYREELRTHLAVLQAKQPLWEQSIAKIQARYQSRKGTPAGPNSQLVLLKMLVTPAGFLAFDPARTK